MCYANGDPVERVSPHLCERCLVAALQAEIVVFWLPYFALDSNFGWNYA